MLAYYLCLRENMPLWNSEQVCLFISKNLLALQDDDEGHTSQDHFCSRSSDKHEATRAVWEARRLNHSLRRMKLRSKNSSEKSSLYDDCAGSKRARSKRKWWRVLNQPERHQSALSQCERYWMLNIKQWQHFLGMYVPYCLVVRISGFHPAGRVV